MYTINGYALRGEALEAFVELRSSQPPRERLHYIETAMESIKNPETRVKLVQKLYADLLKHGDIDFGPIPESKGDLTRYKHYKLMVETISSIEKILGQTKSESYMMTEGLFNMLIECRSDFEYGFKYDIQLIQLCYNVIVLSLHRMIDITMMDYVKTLKQQVGLAFVEGVKPVDNLLVVQAVRGILKAYDKGEWTEMINSFKKGRCNWLGAVGATAKAFGLTNVDNGSITLTGAGAAVVLIIGMIVVLIAIRKLIYLYYSSAYKINDAVERSRNFLQYTIDNDTTQSPNAIAKQKAIMHVFDKLHDRIEMKVFSDDTKAKKQLVESDAQNFSMRDMRFDNYMTASINDSPEEQRSQENRSGSTTNNNNNDDISFF